MRQSPLRQFPSRVRRPKRREALAVLCALLCLAGWDPGWKGTREQLQALVVVDVSQSMNAADLHVGYDPTPVSRLARSRALLQQALRRLPCGSRIGLGVFSEYRSLVLLTPVEVCEHYGELRSILAALNSHMAWNGDSEVAKGLYGALATARSLPGRPTVVFLTDGHETPPVDPRHRPKPSLEPGEVAGLIVGVGGRELVPIPQHDRQGRLLGTWGAADVRQQVRRVVNPNDPGRADEGVQPSMPEATPGREHLSSLREGYLQDLAAQTGLAYHRLSDADALLTALRDDRLAQPVPTRISLRQPAMLLALLLWLAIGSNALPQLRWRRPERRFGGEP